VIDQFLRYLRNEKNRSENTIQRYELPLRDFEDFFRSMDGGLDWTTVDSDVIRSWMEHQMDQGYTASTVNTNLAAVRSLFRFALRRKLVPKDPAHRVAGLKKPKVLPCFVRENDMDRLLDEEHWTDSFKDVRARTIIILLYETGLRCGELVGLDNNDVDFDAMRLKVTGKRNKQRIIPFGEEVAEQLKRYIEVRDEAVDRQCDALFLNMHGQRISSTQVYIDVKENLSKVTMMKKRSPHVLRHSFATAMLNHNAGLESVRQLLGHESLETTQIYTHTTFEQLKRVYKETHPRG